MIKNEVDDLMRANGIVVIGEAVYVLCRLVAAVEREACAKVLDDMADESESNYELTGYVSYYRQIANAIRARREQ